MPLTGAVKGPETVEQGDKAKLKFSSATSGTTSQSKLDKSARKACTSLRKVAPKNLNASNQGRRAGLTVSSEDPAHLLRWTCDVSSRLAPTVGA